MKTMEDYHDLYIKCVVLLLADVFEKFRNNSLKNYTCCPDHYLSAPSLSWDTIEECVLEVDLEYPRELGELYNDYSLAPDKIQVKREILSEYQLKITDLYNIPTGSVKKLVPNFFDKESMGFIMKTCNFTWD